MHCFFPTCFMQSFIFFFKGFQISCKATMPLATGLIIMNVFSHQHLHQVPITIMTIFGHISLIFLLSSSFFFFRLHISIFSCSHLIVKYHFFICTMQMLYVPPPEGTSAHSLTSLFGFV